jgi:uncharacterized protein YbjT (DUF2867 family)
MSRNPSSPNLPGDLEVVRGDLSVPDTLDACLDGVDSVFLVWISPLAAAAPALEKIRAYARQIVLLTSPHRTPHPLFQQPNALRGVHAGVERMIEASGLRWTFLRPGPFALIAAMVGTAAFETATWSAGSTAMRQPHLYTKLIGHPWRFRALWRRGARRSRVRAHRTRIR